MTLLSFHNDPAIKDKYLSRLIAHKEADHLIQGTGWKNGKGCAVGCTLENYNHSLYPVELGIPEWLAYLEDKIFEGLSNKYAMNWPIDFLQSIPVGVDLEQIKIPFLIIIVESVLDTFDHEKYPKTLESILLVLKTLKDKNSTPKDYQYAADAASDAAAAYDDVYAADAADAAAAYYAAYYAAAAYASSSYAAKGVYAASYKDREKKYKYFSKKLINLLKNCK